MTSLVPETGPKHSPPVANAPPALPLQFDGSTATPPRNTLRTASASNNSSPPPVDSARSPAGHHASPSHESQVDGAPSPPSSTSRAGLTPGSPEQIRQALLNDPPRSRLPTAHIINATASPPAYQQTANPTAPTSNRELRFPRLTPTQEKFERTGKAVGYWLKLVWLGTSIQYCSPSTHRLESHGASCLHRCRQWSMLTPRYPTDILFMLLTLAIMGAIMLWAPIFRWQRRYFPVEWDANYKVWRGPVDLSYPQEDFIISTLHAALILNLVPAAILYGIQIWVRDFWDFTAASFGLIKGVIIL